VPRAPVAGGDVGAGAGEQAGSERCEGAGASVVGGAPTESDEYLGGAGVGGGGDGLAEAAGVCVVRTERIEQSDAAGRGHLDHGGAAGTLGAGRQLRPVCFDGAVVGTVDNDGALSRPGDRCGERGDGALARRRRPWGAGPVRRADGLRASRPRALGRRRRRQCL